MDDNAELTPDQAALATPARIGIAGDWHGSPMWAVRAIEHAYAAGATTIVHTGDFGYLFYARFVRPVEKVLEDLGMQLLFVDGNHDNHELLGELPAWPNGLRSVGTRHRIWWLPRGFRWEWHGLQWLALGGAHSVDSGMRKRNGMPWWPQERITEEQAAAAVAGGPADVMITHDCPDGITIPDLEKSAAWFSPAELAQADAHRRVLGSVVRAVRPRWLWHGHFHIPYTASIVDADGWQLTVTGLDCDSSSIPDNITVVDLAELAKEAA